MSINPRSGSILIATLGSEPQVVTATLDLLLKQGELIQETWLIHTSHPASLLQQAVATVQTAFDLPPYQGQIRLRPLPLPALNGQPLEDVATPEATQAAYRFLYQQVRRAKLAGLRVHLSISGGRKLLALFGMSCAQLLFEDADQLWYLYSGGDFLSSKRLHPAPGDDVHLISVPFVHWSRVSPIWTGLGEIDDPFTAAERIQRLQIIERLEEARSFWLGALTAGEQRVVELLVRQGLSDAEIAARLSLSARTVEQHLRSAYAKAAAHWDLANVSRTHLATLLNVYFLMSTSPASANTLKNKGLSGCQESN